MRRSLLRFAAPTLAVLAVGLWMAPASRAQDNATQRLRGEVTRVDGDMIYIRASNGQPATVLLTPDATIISVKPAKLSDIKPGRFVGTAARPEPGGRWQTIEVHIFPVGSRLGEGHHPWAPEPGATMTNADVVARTGNVPALVAERAEKAAGYAEAAKASNTRRAYRSDWQAFETWCAGKGVSAMPAAADTVLAYLIDHAGQLKVATLSRRLSAIREARLYAGHPPRHVG